MWDLIDENGNFYDNIEDISKDFTPVIMKKEEIDVLKQLMTPRGRVYEFPIGYLGGFSPSNMVIPFLDDYFNARIYFKMYLINAEKYRVYERTMSSREAEIKSYEKLNDLNGFNVFSAKATNEYVDEGKIKLIYVPKRHQMYVRGLRQGTDYEYRLAQRGKKIIAAKKREKRENPYKVMGLGERMEQPIITDREKYLEFGASIYAFKDCRLRCINGWYWEDKRVKVENGFATELNQKECPICKRKRKEGVEKRLRDLHSKLSIRQLLNIPENVDLLEGTEKNCAEYRKLRSIVKKSYVIMNVRTMNMKNIYSGLLNLYVSMPEYYDEQNNYRVLQITDVKNIEVLTNEDINCEDVLVIRSKGNRGNLLKDIINIRTEQRLKTILLVG